MKSVHQKKQTEIEAHLWGQGQLPESLNSHDLRVYLTRVRESNLKKAEALCITAQTDVLEEIRTSLARGYFEKVRNIFIEIEQQSPELLNDAEFLLEIARLHVFEGNWSECITFCNRLFEREPSTVTTMTALQVRSVAEFESGNFAHVMKDLEKIEILSELYPKLIASFYSKIMRIKILIHQEMLEPARRQLDELWQIETKAGINGAKILTLLRTEADFARFAGESPLASLIGYRRVANVMGDKLYESLAQLELFFLGAVRANEITEVRQRFARIEKLYKEIIEGSESLSSSAKSIQKFKLIMPTESIGDLNLSHIVLPRLKLNIQIEKLSVQNVGNKAQALNLIRVLSKKPLTKAEVFSQIWGRQKYSSELHDNLIHQLLHQIRKTFGLNITVVDGTLNMKNVVVVA